MKGLKFFSILFLVVVFAGVSLADHQDRDVTVDIENSNGDILQAEDTSEFVIDYDQGSPQPFRVAIYCDGGDCPYGPRDSSLISNPLYLDLCGSRISTPNYITDSDFKTDKLRIPVGGTFGPDGIKCTPGVKDVEIVDSETGDAHTVKDLGTDFVVDYRTSGPQLSVSIDIENLGDKIARFKIENAGDGKDPGQVRVGQSGFCVRDCGDFEEVKTNTILSPFQDDGQKYVDNIDDFMVRTYGNCGFGASLCDVANKDFKELQSSCGGSCPVGHVDQGSGADYIPRGEIIAGQAFSTDTSWPAGPLDSKQFHICDSSLDGFKSMDGKTVYSPGDNFNTDYFECRNDEWIPREQCQPGFEWSIVDGDWECDRKDPVRINVDFLEIQNLPYSQAENGYIAGFRILSGEAEKFEQQYDADLQQVDAECWMGEDDQRPSSSSDKGFVSVDVEDFRTAYGLSNIWALTEIPSREGVDNSTYSCVWGFNGHGKHNQYIYQGVNEYLLESMDEEEIDYYDYEQIEGIYSRNEEAYSNSINWGYYTSMDERSYSDFGANNPFRTPIEEYPYCPPANPLYPEADITC